MKMFYKQPMFSRNSCVLTSNLNRLVWLFFLQIQDYIFDPFSHCFFRHNNNTVRLILVQTGWPRINVRLYCMPGMNLGI